MAKDTSDPTPEQVVADMIEALSGPGTDQDRIVEAGLLADSFLRRPWDYKQPR